MDELVCEYCSGLLLITSKSPTIVCRHCGQTVEVPPGAIARAPQQAAPIPQAAAEPPLPNAQILFSLTFSDGLVSNTGVEGQRRGIKTGPGKEGKAILVANDAILYYPSAHHILAEQGCIQFWLRNRWQGNDNKTYVFFDIGDEFFNRIRLFKDGANNFRFVIWGAKSEHGVFYDVSHWQVGEWHHIRANWYGNKMELYMDGEKSGWGHRGAVKMPTKLARYFFIGSDSTGSQQAESVIDEFSIYSGPVI